MSSGAYVVEVPLALIGMVAGGAVLALGAAGLAAGVALSAAGGAALEGSDAAFSAAEQARARQLELAKQMARRQQEFLRVQEATDAVLADIGQFRESLKSLNFQYSAQTATFTALEEGVSTEATASLNLGDLMFMEVDVRTQEVSYVVLDYSEAITAQNARNSAQFKKMALASDLMKKVMVWVVDDPKDQQQLNQLIGTVNAMLDDDSMSFGHFQQFVQLRFAAFQHLQDSMGHDPVLWDQYCALCAMEGQRPRRLSKTALEREVRQKLEQATAKKFVAGARKAFMEAVAEVGLEVHSDHVLEQVSGSMLVDPENPGYSLFLSEHDVSFMVEMVDTGKAEASQRRQQHDSVCQKRRRLEQIMHEKGYTLKVCATEDDSCAAIAEVAEKKQVTQTRAELLRRRRALAGKTAKLKMAGGK